VLKAIARDEAWILVVTIMEYAKQELVQSF
jgi:hypothetical protein